jgi:hypothetical protein
MLQVKYLRGESRSSVAATHETALTSQCSSLVHDFLNTVTIVRLAKCGQPFLLPLETTKYTKYTKWLISGINRDQNINSL